MLAYFFVYIIVLCGLCCNGFVYYNYTESSYVFRLENPQSGTYSLDESFYFSTDQYFFEEEIAFTLDFSFSCSSNFSSGNTFFDISENVVGVSESDPVSLFFKPLEFGSVEPFFDFLFITASPPSVNSYSTFINTDESNVILKNGSEYISLKHVGDSFFVSFSDYEVPRCTSHSYRSNSSETTDHFINFSTENAYSYVTFETNNQNTSCNVNADAYNDVFVFLKHSVHTPTVNFSNLAFAYRIDEDCLSDPFFPTCFDTLGMSNSAFVDVIDNFEPNYCGSYMLDSEQWSRNFGHNSFTDCSNNIGSCVPNTQDKMGDYSLLPYGSNLKSFSLNQTKGVIKLYYDFFSYIDIMFPFLSTIKLKEPTVIDLFISLISNSSEKNDGYLIISFFNGGTYEGVYDISVECEHIQFEISNENTLETEIVLPHNTTSNTEYSFSVVPSFELMNGSCSVYVDVRTKQLWSDDDKSMSIEINYELFYGRLVDPCLLDLPKPYTTMLNMEHIIDDSFKISDVEFTIDFSNEGIFADYEYFAFCKLNHIEHRISKVAAVATNEHSTEKLILSFNREKELETYICEFGIKIIPNTMLCINESINSTSIQFNLRPIDAMYVTDSMDYSFLTEAKHSFLVLLTSDLFGYVQSTPAIYFITVFYIFPIFTLIFLCYEKKQIVVSVFSHSQKQVSRKSMAGCATMKGIVTIERDKYIDYFESRIEKGKKKYRGLYIYSARKADNSLFGKIIHPQYDELDVIRTIEFEETVSIDRIEFNDGYEPEDDVKSFHVIYSVGNTAFLVIGSLLDCNINTSLTSDTFTDHGTPIQNALLDSINGSSITLSSTYSSVMESRSFIKEETVLESMQRYFRMNHR
ncbi:hypothetical protein PCE1_002451 [Barthelona sp. PCE]